MDTQKTALVCEGLNNIGKYEFSHEYPNLICTEVEGLNITFGHANETWGASVSDDVGADLGYIETELIFDNESVPRLVYETLRGVENFLEFTK